MQQSLPFLTQVKDQQRRVPSLVYPSLSELDFCDLEAYQ